MFAMLYFFFEAQHASYGTIIFYSAMHQSSEMSSRSTSAHVSRGVSEGQSSASGVSDVSDGLDIPLGERSNSLPIDRLLPTKGRESGSRKDGHAGVASSLALEAATATCSMCEVAMSSLLCTQCGRLSFCNACCISLHDNKFLSGHRLVSLEPHREGQVVPLNQLKESAAAKPSPRSAEPINAQKSSTAASEAPSPQRHVDPTLSKDHDLEPVDIAMLAADRNIVQARLSEITACRGLLQTVADGLNKERFKCKDITQTATDAIRQRFDVLRKLLQDKEAEFIATVERAGKQRLEDATKSSFEAVATLTECDAFLDQMRLQIDRVSTNKRLFSEARTSMLTATETKLKTIDEAMQKMQNELDRVVSQTLGIHVNLDAAVEALQGLQAPSKTLPVHAPAVTYSKSIPAEKFTETPAVKVIRQKVADYSTSSTSTTSQPSGVSSHRKLYHQELETLRNTPLRELRSQQQQQHQAATLKQHSDLDNVSQQDSSLSMQLSSAASATVSSISKIAQKFNTSGTAATPIAGPVMSSGNRIGRVPKELERLSQVVASTAQTIQRRGSTLSASALSLTTGSRTRSPMNSAASRGDSPLRGISSQQHSMLRTSSPMRSTQLTPYRHSISPARLNPDATPGPGAYYKPADFTSKGLLSTPPRRR